MATTYVVVIIVALGAVALNKYLAVVVKVKVLCGFYIGFLLFEYAVLSFDFGFADTAFVDTYHACIAMTVGIVLAVVSSAFKSRHVFLLSS